MNDTVQILKDKLSRALKSKAVLNERSKQLQQQVEDFRKREEVMGHIAVEMMERQRELNFMLHRASSVLHQLQDTNRALSAEFTHIVKELPAPGDSETGNEWEETVNKVNDLFAKTHELASEMQDEIFKAASEPDKTNTWADLFGKNRTESKPEPEPAAEPEPVEEEVPEVSIGTAEIIEAESHPSEESVIEMDEAPAQEDAVEYQETLDADWTDVEAEVEEESLTEAPPDIWLSMQPNPEESSPKTSFDAFSAEYSGRPASEEDETGDEQKEEDWVSVNGIRVSKEDSDKQGFFSKLFKRG